VMIVMNVKVEEFRHCHDDGKAVVRKVGKTACFG
jgi:hypothetical protein